MEILRRAANPWGQEILIGIGWSLMWLALAAGVLFVLGHAFWARSHADEPAAPDPGEAAGLPEQITRHKGSARAFHWLMSLAMFALLITAFVPVMGLQFAWVEIHWIAGVALVVLVLWHVFDAVFTQDIWSMWPRAADVTDAIAFLKSLPSGGDTHERAGKYPFDHKLYHHGIVAVGVGVIVTGLLMMVRIDTPFWTRNPYLLGDGTWGVVYVLHGLCGVALITMVIAHVYFAIRPEKWWMTRSMIKGWISRDEYLGHFDPAQWPVDGAATPESSRTAGWSGTPAGVTPSDPHR